MGITFDIITVVHEASITDWIQAVAALLAVIGTVFTLWKLYQRDEQKQAMIGELKTQSEGLQAQTAELNAQVFQLGKIHQVLSEGIATMTKNVDMAEQNRRNDLRPYLVISGIRTAAYGEGWRYTFFNKGGSAEDVSFHAFKGEGTHYQEQSRAERGQSIIIELYAPLSVRQAWSFELWYSDADGVLYRQVVERTKESSFEPIVSPPMLREENGMNHP